MSLTWRVEQRLNAVSLIKFFHKHEATWRAFAQDTYNHTKRNFPDGAIVRMDDLAKALFPIMEVNELLITELARKPLTQQYWVKYFVDLIVDRTWDAIRETSK